MNRSTRTNVAECPSCAALIHFNTRPRLGDIVVCYECEENLEVVRLDPIKLDWSLLDDDESWADMDIDEYEERYDRDDDHEWN
jgi:lysine biosynthesis protein LysW